MLKSNGMNRFPTNLNYVNPLPRRAVRGVWRCRRRPALGSCSGAPQRAALGPRSPSSRRVCPTPQNVRIDPSSLSFSMWKEIPIPFYFSAYFFDIVNPNEILQGEKPQVRQRGPYVYR